MSVAPFCTTLVGKLLTLLSNTKQASKCLQETNALAYFIEEENSLIIMALE
jgi:hypothetical protein